MYRPEIQNIPAGPFVVAGEIHTATVVFASDTCAQARIVPPFEGSQPLFDSIAVPGVRVREHAGVVVATVVDMENIDGTPLKPGYAAHMVGRLVGKLDDMRAGTGPWEVNADTPRYTTGQLLQPPPLVNTPTS